MRQAGYDYHQFLGGRQPKTAIKSYNIFRKKKNPTKKKENYGKIRNARFKEKYRTNSCQN